MIWLPVVGNYADVDVYASIIAYADLLNQRGKPARTYIPVAPNYSVPAKLRLPEREGQYFDLQQEDQAIILDLSDPAEIAKLVPDEQILELIDHHPGYEQYWQERIGDKAIIEPIGAVATSIFEWWGECWDYQKMSPEIARLLLAAILDNTLNFNAAITTDRDRAAAARLAELLGTTVEEFATRYFAAVSQGITADLEKALTQDLKLIAPPKFPFALTIGQLAVWDARDTIAHRAEIAQIMNKRSGDWLVNILSISERRNYLLTNSENIAEYFTKLLNLQAEGDFLVSDQLYLRKEILKKILEQEGAK